jgi:GMP synthase (glutamine-hydrolysing)
LSRRTILIVKTGEALPPVKALLGDFEEWIARGLGRRLDDLEVANVYQGDALPNAREISGVVVTGSPAMVSERADWSEDAARWLADVVREDVVPALGLCYGHQLFAHGLGGEVGANPNGREVGTVDVTFDPDPRDSSDVPAMEGKGERALSMLFESGVFPAHMTHVESVLRLPMGARVLARTALDPHAVVEFGPRQWGVQFHPEFDRLILQRYVDARREVLEEEGFEPDRLIADAIETPALSSILARFADFALAEGRAESGR